MNIWHIENKSWNQLLLWRTADTNFRVTKQGEFLPLLTNPNYMLIEETYKNILENISDQVTFIPTIIIDHVLKTESQNYFELQVHTSIDHETIGTENSNGIKIWSSGCELFVSENLKNILIGIDPDAFEFTLGFSNFAGR